jgi:hypothetical protein
MACSDQREEEGEGQRPDDHVKREMEYESIMVADVWTRRQDGRDRVEERDSVSASFFVLFLGFCCDTDVIGEFVCFASIIMLLLFYFIIIFLIDRSFLFFLTLQDQICNQYLKEILKMAMDLATGVQRVNHVDVIGRTTYVCYDHCEFCVVVVVVVVVTFVAFAFCKQASFDSLACLFSFWPQLTIRNASSAAHWSRGSFKARRWRPQGSRGRRLGASSWRWER